MKFNKTLFAGLNASFSHTALALYSLVRMPLETEAVVREFTINENRDSVFRAIIEENADLVAFSCYIWNIDIVLTLARRIKAARPQTAILLGGPEVSYDAGQWIKRHAEIDLILSGEGEESLPLLFTGPEENVPGLWYREEGNVKVSDKPLDPVNLSGLPPVYRNFSFQDHKMYYYEASRGCPYRCSFCLSSNEPVRTVPMQQVKEELHALLKAKVMIVKFVDRTMNADPARFHEILRFISEEDNGITRFHMEIHPTALRDASIQQIQGLRKGLVQFEIGVQSTHEPTCQAIRRVGDTTRIGEVVARLRTAGNVHLHLDLIAGLPYEDMRAFASSFEHVMDMQPHMLQLGFLKLLRGSDLRKQAEQYGIRFPDDAPYEVVATKWMSPEDLFFLKDVESLVDHLYNTSCVQKTLLYFRYRTGSWWELFSALARFARENGYLQTSRKQTERYDLCLAFGRRIGSDETILQDLLRYDMLMQTWKWPASVPIRFDNWTAERFLSKEVQQVLAEIGRTDPKNGLRKTQGQHFQYDIHAYFGDGTPCKREHRLLFLYKEETSVHRIGKGMEWNI